MEFTGKNSELKNRLEIFLITAGFWTLLTELRTSSQMLFSSEH